MGDFYDDHDALETFARVFGASPMPRGPRPTWTLSGGPRGPLVVPGSHLPVREMCRRPAGGAWEHYLPVADREFVYAGPCVEFHGEPSDDLGCCCGDPACDGR